MTTAASPAMRDHDECARKAVVRISRIEAHNQAEHEAMRAFFKEHTGAWRDRSIDCAAADLMPVELEQR